MPRIKGPRKVYQYSNEFKVTAVRLSHLPGVQVKDVAEELDIHPFMLSRWRKEYREGNLEAKVKKSIDPKTAAELKRLKCQHQLQMSVFRRFEMSGFQRCCIWLTRPAVVVISPGCLRIC